MASKIKYLRTALVFFKSETKIGISTDFMDGYERIYFMALFSPPPPVFNKPQLRKSCSAEVVDQNINTVNFEQITAFSRLKIIFYSILL